MGVRRRSAHGPAEEGESVIVKSGKAKPSKAMTVAGIMSGTSADGINVALVKVVWTRATRQRKSSFAPLSFKFIAHAEYPYPKDVRRAVLEAMNATKTSVAQLARLNFLLAELYAEAVLTTQRRFHQKVDLIGCHGQTLYHQGEPALFLGRKVAVTWQTGEGSVLAARVGVPVVSDFRPADMAAGGKGAPLVPFLDYLLYRKRPHRPDRAEYWWHCQSDGDSRESLRRQGHCIRHWTRQHGDRCGHGATVPQTL